MSKPYRKRTNQRYKKYKRDTDDKVVKKCKFCNCEMKPRGASDAVGRRSWKCKNKKCGRTVWQEDKVLPPNPLVPVSHQI